MVRLPVVLAPNQSRLELSPSLSVIVISPLRFTNPWVTLMAPWLLRPLPSTWMALVMMVAAPGVSYGAHDHGQFEPLKPRFIAHTVKELHDWLLANA